MQNNILKTELSAKQRVLLIGPPGCAKSERIKAEFTTAGIPLVIWRASLMERVDISGCIIPDNGAGVSRQLPFVDIKRLQDTKTPIGLFIDDLGQAPGDVQAAIMRLFDNEIFDRSKVIV